MIDYRQQLTRGAAKLGVELSESVTDQLLDYHAMLVKWNRAYNLTAVRDPSEMISRHLLDSLSILPHLSGERFIDVGTGPGLPGVVLAICRPDWQIDLLDSNGKKTRFLIQAVSQLGLSCQVYNCRVESHQPAELYDGVISRAFASLKDMVDGSQHLLAPNGHFFAMKGLYPEDELCELPKPFKVECCHSLQVPGCDGQRHLLLINAAP